MTISIVRALFKSKIFRILLYVLIGTIIILLLAHIIWSAVASAKLASAREAARASGILVERDQVIPKPCPDEENAALLYNQAFGLMTLGHPYVPGHMAGSLDKRLSKILAEKDLSPTDILQELESDIFSQIWQLQEQGSRLPRCRFERDYDKGAGVRLPEITHLREITQLSVRRIEALIALGRSQEAINLLVINLRMIQQQREDPFLVCQMVADANLMKFLDSLRVNIKERRFSNCDFSDLLLNLEFKNRDLMKQHCLQAEAVLCGEWSFRQFEQGALDYNKTYSINIMDESFLNYLNVWIGAPWIQNDEAYYWHYMSQVYQVYTGQKQEFPQFESSSIRPISSIAVGLYDSINAHFNEVELTVKAAHASVQLLRKETPKPDPQLQIKPRSEGGWVIEMPKVEKEWIIPVE